MIRGAQIRKARELLGWRPHVLANRTKLSSATIHRAESMEREPPITIAQQVLIRRVPETAGIVLIEGDPPDVRLRAGRSTSLAPHQLRAGTAS
jgi:transcriptional regulator with XRE-family HTH domain